MVVHGEDDRAGLIVAASTDPPTTLPALPLPPLLAGGVDDRDDDDGDAENDDRDGDGDGDDKNDDDDDDDNDYNEDADHSSAGTMTAARATATTAAAAMVTATTTTPTATDVAIAPPPHPPPADIILPRSHKSTLHLRTDLTKAIRDVHPCGILHFSRIGGDDYGGGGGGGATGGRGTGAEEHAFVWMTRHDDARCLSNAFRHMSKFGFDSRDAVFLPYSSRRNWIARYPLAFPHVHCDGDGIVAGCPFWSSGGGGGGAMGVVVGRAACATVPYDASDPSWCPTTAPGSFLQDLCTVGASCLLCRSL